MALPKINVPVYSVKLVSTGDEVRFRPFTVKEEKLFLMASQSEDTEYIFNTILQVLNNCMIDEIDIEKLPLFDVEHMFLNLRARSVGEKINLKYKCNNDVTDEDGALKKCGNVVEIGLNVLEIETKIDEAHNKKIQLMDNLGVVMKYPTLKMLNNYKNTTEELDIIIDLIVDCIDYVYDDESVYYAKDNTKEELMDFLDSLQTKDLEKIKNFFDTMPRLKKDLEFKCKKCEHEEKIELEGIQSFFV